MAAAQDASAVGFDALPHAFTIAPLVARTATETFGPFGVEGAAGLIVVVKATAEVATASVVFTVEGVGPNGETWVIATSAAVEAVGTTVLRIHPAIGNVAGASCGDLVPSKVQVTATHADADALTYTVAGILTP